MAATPSPSMTHKPRPSSNFLLLVFLLLTIPSSLPSASPSPPKISYTDHCNSIAPQSPPTGVFLSPSESFHISDGNYSGGHKILSTDPESSPADPHYSNPGFRFYTNYIHKTRSPDILQLGGSLSFQGPQFRTRDSHPRHHRTGSLPSFVITQKYAHFELSGFWSESTGMICMVGTGSSNSIDGKSLFFSAVFKLNYPKVSTISTSLVHGTVYSLDPVESPNFFDNISVLAYAQNNYSYMQFPLSIKDSCSNLRVPKETRGFEVGSLGSYVPNLLRGGFGLENESDCNGKTCPPSFFTLHQIYCSAEGKLHMRIGLSDFRPHWFYDHLDPENSLVAEGFWDHEKNHMCLVACPVLGNASVGECTIGLSLWFPMVLSINDRSTVVGRIWSNKDKNDPGYFSTMSFRDFGGHMSLAPSMRYEYSTLDGSSKCDAIKNNSIIRHKTYPDGSSMRDLGFSVSFKRGESVASGYAYPLSLGDTVFVDSFVEAPMSGVNDTLWKISYDISYSFYNSSSTASQNHTQISAEGLYNSMNGQVCMVGCVYLRNAVLNMKARTGNSMDCSYLINIQLAPMNPEKGEHLNGTIMSTRHKSDPLHFDPILFSSHIMYEGQAAKSIRRMDIEIIMIIVSLTLSCIFIRAQILYVKKSRGVLPSVSIIMLVVMTLGYLIPLILNFEALLIMIQNKQRSSFWPGEWMAVKEAVVRVLTLVAFVLHLRFLQVAWSARSEAEDKRDLWVAEQKSLKLYLVLYSLGAVFAWFVQSKSQSHRWDWENLLSFAGFILDGFLFPQIMINLFRNSQEKALSLPFYLGMTIIRMFPHLYDLYRARNSLPYLQSSHIYASPEAGFYSSAWDIIIPLTGALFAISIFMQQHFGGSCILPPRLRKNGGYMTIDELNL